jgi:hypothetical protein
MGQLQESLGRLSNAIAALAYFLNKGQGSVRAILGNIITDPLKVGFGLRSNNDVQRLLAFT